MPNIYESGLSPLIELAKTALPGRRVLTAEDVARLLDPTTGAARRVSTGGVNLQVHPEEWRYLRGPDIQDILENNGRPYRRDDVLQMLQNPTDDRARQLDPLLWNSLGKGHESYTLPGPRTNYRVRGLTGVDGLTDSGDYSYHFADAPVHARLSNRALPGSASGEDPLAVLAGLRYPSDPDQAARHAEELRRMGPNTAQSVLLGAYNSFPPGARDQRVIARRDRLGSALGLNGPRSTHLDELQSDFYSMRPQPANNDAEIARLQALYDAAEARFAAHPASGQYQDFSEHPWGSELRQLSDEAGRARDALVTYQNGGERPRGPFEKLWPRLAFNQVANEALDKGHDMVTWSPPWVHDRLYRGVEPGVFSFDEDSPAHLIRSRAMPSGLVMAEPKIKVHYNRSDARGNTGNDLDSFLSGYRGPQAAQLREYANNPLSLGLDTPIPITGQYWHDPSSLMYHNMYGPRGVVEDSARRFLRAYGEDPAANLTTTRLEGAGWEADRQVPSRLRPETNQSSGADVPAMLITPRMRDIYKRLRDEGRPGVPLYAAGGSVSAASIEDHLLGRV